VVTVFVHFIRIKVNFCDFEAEGSLVYAKDTFSIHTRKLYALAYTAYDDMTCANVAIDTK